MKAAASASASRKTNMFAAQRKADSCQESSYDVSVVEDENREEAKDQFAPVEKALSRAKSPPIRRITHPQHQNQPQNANHASTELSADSFIAPVKNVISNMFR